ncbi:hypothetical protein B0A50_05122 [Salinomyces thailandicus]|uniref:Uncharacterized protein n=1 Tax=Salinomyces thailandicus TaxID=706561 RepID=A0A4U0TVF4_9PEZI|nr:hypothetical protein B0A50_05122 [Salinomyces thailandica]
MSFAEPTNPVAARSQLIYRALREAGLAVDQPGELEFFGVPAASPSSMARASPSTAQYLIFCTAPDQAQQAGPATLKAEVLAARVISMGNLLPALAALQDRGYSQRQQDDWRATVSHLHTVLLRLDGQRYDAMTMPAELREALRLCLINRRIDTDRMDVFNSASQLSADFNTLLSYLTQVSFQYRVDEERKREQARRRAAAQAGAAAQRRRTRPESLKRCVVM